MKVVAMVGGALLSLVGFALIVSPFGLGLGARAAVMAAGFVVAGIGLALIDWGTDRAKRMAKRAEEHRQRELNKWDPKGGGM